LTSLLGKLSCALLAGIAVVCACGLAGAASPDAAVSFDRGLSLYKKGKYEQAAAAFMRAYKSVPHADSLYNAGLAFELAGDKATAATAYVIALAKELGREAREDATRRLERLSAELGRIEISAPDDAKISVPPFSLPGSDAVFYLEPGRHRVLVTLEDGTPLSRPVDSVAGDTSVVLVEASQAGDPEASPDEPTTSKQSRADGSGSSDLKTLGWVSIGVAAVAAGAAVLLGLETLSAKRDYDESGHRNADDFERAERLMVWTNVAWVTAAITGVAGGVLLYTSHDEKSGTSAGIQLHGRF
jgi:tetratricopeptide (TPR) repeat protein